MRLLAPEGRAAHERYGSESDDQAGDAQDDDGAPAQAACRVMPPVMISAGLVRE